MLKALYVIPGFLCVSSFLPWTQSFFVTDFKEAHFFSTPIVMWTDGILFKFHFLFTNILIVAGYVLLFTVFMKDGIQRKKQALLMILGVSSEVILDVIVVKNNLPFRWFNHGAIACFPLLLSYTYCLYKYDLIDILPMAKENVFDHLPAPIFVLANSGSILASNQYASKNIDASNVKNILLEKIHGAQNVFEVALPTRSGKDTVFQVHIDGLRNRFGNTIGFTAVFLDITSHIEAKEQMRDMNILKDRIFSVIAHDVSGNLSGIELLADLTSRQVQEKNYGLIEQNLYQLKDGVRSAKSVLSGLLKWVQAGSSYEDETIHVVSEIYAAKTEVSSLASSKAIAWDLQLNNLSDLKVPMNKEMFRSIVRNILSNAIQATPELGKIYVVGKIQGSHWTLMIQDQGAGMPSTSIDLLNQGLPLKNETRDSSKTGLGIGLSVVQDFVKKNKGTLIAANQESGLLMTVSFPL